MSIDINLVKLNAKAFEGVQQKICAIEKKIEAYHAQTKTIHYLAILTLATLAALIAKLAWVPLSGTRIAVSSSIILGIFNLAAGIGTFWYWIEGKNKAKQIGDEISALITLTGKKFYGETTERKEDLETKIEVLDSIEQNLLPCFEKGIHVEKNYLLLATNELTIKGDTLDTFSYSAVKISDNFKEVKTAVAAWRKFYSDLHTAEPKSRTSTLMKAIASQCVQGLPSMTVKDAAIEYACSSPSAQYPKNGNISLCYQFGRTPITNYTNAVQFRKYLEDLPKVKRY